MIWSISIGARTGTHMSHEAQWIHYEVEAGKNVLFLAGRWRLANLVPISDAIGALSLHPARELVLDGSRLDELDSAACFEIYRFLVGLGYDGETVSVRRFKDGHFRLLGLVHDRMKSPPAQGRAVHLGLVQRLGAAVLNIWHLLKVHNAFIGAVAMDTLRLLRMPSRFRGRETVSQFETICLDAIPIVALVTSLIGVVFAYLLGLQAQKFGASIFVVDGVGLAICRELSPILVAIVVAGRSGASFTAQIGTMKVAEEIDAISTLGLSPIHVLVIPRLLAIMLALPLLVFVGDLTGILGAALVADWQLGITYATFLDRLQGVLPMSAPVVGIVKAPVFAAFIAVIACRMGMEVRRDARSVGLNTTSTVVQSIVWVILLDAGFAVMFQHLGI